MKTKHFPLWLSLAALTFTSCGDHTHGESTHPTTKTETHEHHGEQHAGAIRLNNGEKWVVNQEMKPHVADGEAALNDYITSNGTDYKALASELEEANNALISSCTMEGESHDKLHKWLHPHIELVAELADAQNSEEANAVAEKLKESYQNYHTYFD